MIACTLVALAVGYFVFAHASSHKGDVHLVGRAVGIIIMVVALVGVACGVVCKAQGMNCFKSGGMMMKGSCPVMGK